MALEKCINCDNDGLLKESKKQKKSTSLLFTFFIFLFSLLVFGSIIYLDVFTDIQVHAEFLLEIAQGKSSIPFNFIYYGTVYLFSFFQSNYSYMLCASVFVLSVSVALKYWISQQILIQELALTSVPPLLLSIFVFGLCLAFNLPNVIADNFYLGQIPPNVWHNSTLIFLMPFALLLYWISWQQLQVPTKRRIVLIGLLIVINLLIKPSFFLVFVWVYPLFLLFKFRWNKNFWLNLIPLIGGLLLLGLEYLFIFQLEENSIYEQEIKSGISIKPFFIWSYYSKTIPFSFLISVLFPLSLLLAYPKKVLKNKLFQYTLALFLGGLLLFILIAETGNREYHGNFSWQNIITCYFLFMVSGMLFLKEVYSKKKWFKRDYLLSSIFGLHVLTGILYIFRLLWKNTYF